MKILLIAFSILIISFLAVIMGYSNADKSYFFSSLERELDIEKNRIWAYKLFPEHYTKICIWKTHSLNEDDFLNKLQGYENYEQAKSFLQRKFRDYDLHLGFLIAEHSISSQFVLSPIINANGKKYSIRYGDSSDCYHIQDLSFKIMLGKFGYQLSME